MTEVEQRPRFFYKISKKKLYKTLDKVYYVMYSISHKRVFAKEVWYGYAVKERAVGRLRSIGITALRIVRIQNHIGRGSLHGNFGIHPVPGAPAAAEGAAAHRL